MFKDCIQVLSALSPELPNYIQKNLPYTLKIFLLCDEHSSSLFGNKLQNLLESSGFKVNSLKLPAGEETKSLTSLEKIWNYLHLSGADKQTLFINLGGGMISDLGGFAAATYQRGLPLINIPTTLMAMVDAAIGGKNGINTPLSKNSLGTVYFPQAVLIDTSLLASLPEKEISNGIAEVIKYAYIQSDKLLKQLRRDREKILSKDLETLKSLILQCVAIKTQIVQQAQYKNPSLRDILNFGHTFGHAIETLGRYQEFSHGEAISLGMLASLHCGYFLSISSGELIEPFKKLLNYYHLPTQLPPSYSVEKLIAIMKRDKKNQEGKIRLIVVKKIGEAIRYSLSNDKPLEKALKALIKQNEKSLSYYI